MTEWSRKELEDAFTKYVEVTQRCAQSGDWQTWADNFSEDVEYFIDDDLVWKGREQVREESVAWFSGFPQDHMRHFIVNWHVIDEDRGWVIFEILNRMDDPGDGSIHELKCLMKLVYGGKNLWRREEDFYDPSRMQAMVEGWAKVKKSLSPGD